MGFGDSYLIAYYFKSCESPRMIERAELRKQLNETI